MLQIRRSEDRGLADHGWLKSRHTFSFAEYFDPAHMQFGPLRVINEDRIEGGTGFGSHPHRDMEIISYVLEGALEHKDSMGNVTTIQPGDVQRMSAGTGVVHSEYNKMSDKNTHFLQIWIIPEKRGIPPSYGQKSFKDALEKQNKVLVVSKSGRDGSISINQDADLYISRLKSGEDLNIKAEEGRALWIQVVRGELKLNDQDLKAGDGVAVANEKSLTASASMDSEFLIFDLPSH